MVGTWPEVTFCINGRQDLVQDWEVLDEVTAGDHRYMRFKIGEKVTRLRNRRYKTKKENLRKFETLLIGQRKEL